MLGHVPAAGAVLPRAVVSWNVSMSINRASLFRALAPKGFARGVPTCLFDPSITFSRCLGIEFTSIAKRVPLEDVQRNHQMLSTSAPTIRTTLT
jgi:hypothetical protein